MSYGPNTIILSCSFTAPVVVGAGAIATVVADAALVLLRQIIYSACCSDY